LSDKKDLKKTRILQAALECFRQYGYSKSTFKDVAVKAGISRASLYTYFKNKDELFVVMTKDSLDRHFKKSQEILNSDLSEKEKLWEIIKEWMLGPYSRIMKTPYSNGWLDGLTYISEQTETIYRNYFIKSIAPLVGKELAKVIVLSIKGLAADRPPVKALNKRTRILVKNSFRVSG
jgi:AcrR family transcriptional regulator